jgi:5-formyltetrahydrofolate cyclo-ligase
VLLGDVKKAFRMQVKESMDAMDPSYIYESSIRISLALYSLVINFAGKGFIGGYIPMKREVNIFSHEIWNTFFCQHKIALPFLKSENEMGFMSYSKDYESFQLESFQFSPAGADAAKIVEPEVIICPGLAFGLNGSRLGRGKGFYDRYLQNYSSRKVGVCFSSLLYAQVPEEDNDIKMDYIVTENKRVTVTQK